VSASLWHRTALVHGVYPKRTLLFDYTVMWRMASQCGMYGGAISVHLRCIYVRSCIPARELRLEHRFVVY